MKKALFPLVVFWATLATAQPIQFSVQKDSTGRYYLIQGAHRTPFDTTTVAAQIAEKRSELAAIDDEIRLLERLRTLRERAVLVKQEDEVLTSILQKARQCVRH